MKPHLVSIATVLVALMAATAAHAEDIGQHPAVFAPRALPAVNPSTFIVGHPASPTTRGGHANHEHPAVLAARVAAVLDPNAFIVQPPASVHWLAASPSDLPVAMK